MSAVTSFKIKFNLLSYILPISSLVYIYNEYRQCDIIFDESNKSAIATRNILPFFPKKIHMYKIESDNSITTSEFRNLVVFETKHPIARSFARLFLYVKNFPYPVVSNNPFTSNNYTKTIINSGACK